MQGDLLIRAKASRHRQRILRWNAATENNVLVDELIGMVDALRLERADLLMRLLAFLTPEQKEGILASFRQQLSIPDLSPSPIQP